MDRYSYSKKRRSKLTNSSDVLHSIFENGNSILSEQFLRWKLWRKWPEFVGSTVGNNSEPVSYIRGTLYVWVKNSSWLQQMVFMRAQIRDVINKKLGIPYVREISLTMDKKSVPQDPSQAAEFKKSLSTLVKNLNNDITQETLDDDDPNPNPNPFSPDIS